LEDIISHHLINIPTYIKIYLYSFPYSMLWNLAIVVPWKHSEGIAPAAAAAAIAAL
jgi:hypothetical protein